MLNVDCSFNNYLHLTFNLTGVDGLRGLCKLRSGVGGSATGSPWSLHKVKWNIETKLLIITVTLSLAS